MNARLGAQFILVGLMGTFAAIGLGLLRTPHISAADELMADAAA